MTASALSGTTTTFTSGASDTHREDLSDLLTNIDKKRCVFTDSIGKGTCSALLHEWPEDTLADSAANAQVEGADAEFTEVAQPTAPNNRVQLSAKWFLISSLQSAVDKAGRKNEIAYQTEKKLKELAKDIERAILNNTSAVAFSAGTAGQCNGLKGFITSNTYNFSASYSATNDLTFEILNDQLEAAHADYGDPNMIFAPSKQKRVISGFDQNNRITVNADASSKKLVAAVDYLETDFGMLQVKLIYELQPDDNSGTYYDFLPIVDTSGWKLCFLKGHGTKVEKLAKTGLAEKVQISAAYTLECRNEKRNALISYLSRV